MLRLRVAQDSGGEGSYLGMHMLAKLPSAGSTGRNAQDRLLYDKDAYLRHLEHQVETVALAREQVEGVREEHEVLLGEVGKLGLRVEEHFSRVREGEARRDVLEGRVQALATLGDRVAALEVQSTQQQSPFMALIERVMAVEASMQELKAQGQRAERARAAEVATLAARLEVAEAANEKLRGLCRDLEAAQQDAVERLQHEMGMGLNRALSASTKQGMLVHEELARLQQQVAELQRAVAGPRQAQQQQQQEQESTRRSEPAEKKLSCEHGNQQEERSEEGSAPAAAAAGAAWEKKLRMLTAAFRLAEEHHQRTREEQQATLAALQRNLAVVGETALATTRRQAEAVLGVVRQLEGRLQAIEQAVGTEAALPSHGGVEMEEREQPREELVAFLGVGRWQEHQQQSESPEEEEEEERALPVAEDSELQAHTALAEALRAVESLKGELQGQEEEADVDSEGHRRPPAVRAHATATQPPPKTPNKRGGEAKKRVARKSLIPHPPSSPPPAPAQQQPRVRPPPRLTAATGSEEKARFLSWLSQQSVAEAQDAAATAATAAAAAPVRRRQSSSQQHKASKTKPSLLKRAYHNVLV